MNGQESRLNLIVMATYQNSEKICKEATEKMAGFSHIMSAIQAQIYLVLLR